MIAAPAGFTARFTAWPRGAKVFTRVHLPPAGRLAVSIAPLTPAQAAIALPDPSMPITGPPKASVDRITAGLHWPPGGRTLAWTGAWPMAGGEGWWGVVVVGVRRVSGGGRRAGRFDRDRPAARAG